MKIKKISIVLFFLMLVFNFQSIAGINEDNFSFLSIRTDTTPPVVTIINPTVTTVGDTVTIAYQASDESSITEYSLYIDDTLVATNNTIYYWDTDQSSAGTHVISARAKDEYNNWGEESITVTVDKSYETGVVKVMAYNIWESGNANNDAWLDVAKEENADIIIAVETGSWNDNNGAKMKEAINALNTYFPNEEPFEGWTTPGVYDPTHGCSILSRYPIVSTEKVTTSVLDDNTTYGLYREVLHAVIEIGETYVNFLGVHLKCCGGTSPELSRERDMEAIINYMDTLGPVPIIIAGDFNSFSPADTGELAAVPGNLGCGPISMLLNDSNPHASTVHHWVDAYRELNPHEKGYSYIDDVYESRIDFIFANDFFFDKLVNSTVGDTPSAEKGSDHYPVDVFLNFDASTSDIRPPVAPYGLDGIVINENRFNLTWIPNEETDLDHYVVYRGDYKVTEVDVPYFVDDTVEPGIHYPYKVTAVDTSGNEGLSSHELIVETSYGICTKPQAPILTGYPGNHKTVLIWEMPDTGGLPILEYRIYRIFYDTPDGTITILKGIVPGNVLGFTDTENYNGHPADWVVSAVNVLGESNYSNAVTVTPSADADEPPEIPTTTTSTTTPAPPYTASTVAPISNNSESTTTTTSLGLTTSSTSGFSVLFILAVVPIIIYKKKH